MTDPRSWNLYTYVRNNPMRYTDPSGERIWIYYQESITRTLADGTEVSESVTRRVEYTFAGLRNEDGSEYTGNNAYVANAASNLTFLLGDQVLAGAIREMVRSREDFNIMRDPTNSENNQADPTKTQRKGKGTTIYWSGNPAKYWTDVFEVNQGGFSPAFAVLAHELIGHAWMKFKGIERTGDEYITDPRFTGYRAFGWVPRREIDAVNIENRAMMIEAPGACTPCRTQYAGRDISPFLDFEGFLEPKSGRRSRPTLKLSPNSRPR